MAMAAKIFMFTFTQGPLVTVSPDDLPTDADAFSRLNLTLLFADQYPVQVGETVRVYAAQWNITGGPTYEWTGAEYVAAFAANPALALPFGNSGLTLDPLAGGEGVSDISADDPSFNDVVGAAAGNVPYIADLPVNEAELIVPWFTNVVDAVWN